MRRRDNIHTFYAVDYAVDYAVERENKNRLLLLIISVVLSLSFFLIAGEVYIRSKSTIDEDGNFLFAYRWLKPYRLPIKTVEKKLDNFARHPEFNIIYDPDLGWNLRPGSVSGDGLYIVNSHGIRSASINSDVSPTPTEGKLRIVLLGDSFTFANDVPFEHTWGYLLEKKLNENNVNAEVLNFGVEAYGLDQAYLRWKKQARNFKPDIVILGLYYDDVCRNVNLLWSVRVPDAGIVFTKPRFVLSGDSLELINSPTMKPAEVLNFLKNLGTSPLSEYEEFFYKPDYEKRFWHNSRLLSFLNWKFFEDRYDLRKVKTPEGTGPMKCYDPESESGKIALKIMEALEKDAREQKAKLMVVHLPWRLQLRQLLKGNPLPYEKLLNKLDENYDVIDPTDKLLQSAREDSVYDLFVGHYSLKGNEIISDIIAEHIMSMPNVQP